MASEFYVARAVTTIHASISNVWNALVDPALIKQYMFGASVSSDWKGGSPIGWKGEWQGKPYEDKGVILRIEPTHVLQYSHFSPLSGQPETPENYHTVTIELCEEPSGTRVSLSTAPSRRSTSTLSHRRTAARKQLAVRSRESVCRNAARPCIRSARGPPSPRRVRPYRVSLHPLEFACLRDRTAS